MKSPKVIVCQHGARKQYAIPQMLEQAGMLKALYTDSCEYSLLGKIAKAMEPLARGRVLRLANRKIEGIPKNKIHTSDRYAFQQIVNTKQLSMIECFQAMNESLVPALRRWGIRNANVFYSVHGEDVQYLTQIRGKIRIVVEVCVSPLAHRAMLTEYSKDKDIDVDIDEFREYTRFREEHFIATATLADLLLCPSRWVAAGVTKLCPQDAHKIKICPYGSSINYDGRINKPVNGRIFWAGGDWIRKGLHYLAQAADKLKQQYPNMDFRVAGITNPQVINMRRFKNMNFLGKLSTQEMQEEYLTADMFVFPTLSEGMAGVVIEALLAGCPVVTTEAAGIDAIENGKSGLIVPARDSEVLAEAIEHLYINRALRDTITQKTVEVAKLYAVTMWKQRLTGLIESF